MKYELGSMKYERKKEKKGERKAMREEGNAIRPAIGRWPGNPGTSCLLEDPPRPAARDTPPEEGMITV